MFLPNVDFFLNSAFLQTHKNFNLPSKFLFFPTSEFGLVLLHHHRWQLGPYRVRRCYCHRFGSVWSVEMARAFHVQLHKHILDKDNEHEGGLARALRAHSVRVQHKSTAEPVRLNYGLLLFTLSASVPRHDVRFSENLSVKIIFV